MSLDTRRRSKSKIRLSRNAAATAAAAKRVPGRPEDALLFRAAFDNAVVGMAITSPDFRFIQVNSAFAQILGYSVQQLTGMSFLDVTHPDDVAMSREKSREVLAREQATLHIEKRYRHRDGHDIWTEISSYLLRDEQGEPLYFISSVLDITERKRLEEAQLKSDSLMKAALENLPLIFYVIDPTGIFQLSIGAGLTGLGLKQNQVVGLSVFDVYGAYPDIIAGIGRALQGNTVTYESMVGHASYFNICVPIHNAQGTFTGTAGAALDTSEFKRVEQALRDSESGYRALVRGLPDVVIRFDRECRHLFASENVRLITDLEASQFAGKTHQELGFSEGQCKVWEDSIKAVFRDRTAVESEFEYDLRGQHWVFDWRLLPEFDEQGAVKSVLSISRDVTRQRRAEADYQTLFREMPYGVALHEIICDEHGRPTDYKFLSLNPAFERLTGLETKSIVGRTALEVIPSLEPHWIERYGKVALTGEPAYFNSGNAAIGKHFDVTAFCPAPRQFVCIFSDVTDRVHAEQAKAKLEAQLQQAQKLESVGRLAGGVAHDFNNMLGVILGNVELAVASMDRKDPVFTELTEIRKAAERSAALTQQLLAFARQQPVLPKVIEPSEAIEGMLKMLRRLIGERITLKWQPADALWNIRMDPSQFNQILTNLCVNARDAIADIGTLVIEVNNQVVTPEAAHRRNGVAPGEYVLISVSDSGSGIPDTALEHIFEPFFTTKRVGDGTGLGLAMVHGAVSQNAGFVDVKSQLGHGSTFSVYLPRYVGDEAEERPTDAIELRAKLSGTVLLVEDEIAMLQVVQRLLEANGYTVIAASTPNEAMAAVETNGASIDLLIADVILPEMNGRELSERVVAKCPRTKVLFMSGYTANVLAPHGVLEKNIHFIEKPFARKDLLAQVREILTGPPAASQSSPAA